MECGVCDAALAAVAFERRVGRPYLPEAGGSDVASVGQVCPTYELRTVSTSFADF